LERHLDVRLLGDGGSTPAVARLNSSARALSLFAVPLMSGSPSVRHHADQDGRADPHDRLRAGHDVRDHENFRVVKPLEGMSSLKQRW